MLCPLLYSFNATRAANVVLSLNLCCTREKQKAENKDRKVLEILQAKDYRIQELEQVPGELYTAPETRA